MWIKSSYSAYNGSCVEVARPGSAVLVRDSKDPQSPVLKFTPGEWRAFLEGLGGAGGLSPGASTA